jgi:hypothetical protein
VSRRKRLHAILVALAVLFGLITIIAGGRVLLGADPGYVVFWPLLYYNTTMGFAYVATGASAWRNLKLGMYLASAIFILNLLVLGAISYLFLAGETVAVESVHAMTARTAVWLVLFVGLAWAKRKSSRGNDA